ncbi:MAG: biotin-dependent carboxyltransferase [Marichromatium sp.]|nr:biotin-dependent carboxyltransferase [Marichromatium sp.]
MKALEVLNPGPLCSVQDPGRKGASLAGLSQSGAADEVSYYLANHLLQNRPAAPMLEIAYGNASFCAKKRLSMVVTGADTTVRVEGKPVPMWRTFWLEKGQKLTLDMARSGQWIYLGVKGELVVPPLFESAATSLRENMGGKVCAKGDELEIVPHDLPHRATLKPALVPDFTTPLRLRVVLGYQAKYFTSTYTKTFFESTYTITPQSNRMGYRLEGAPIGYEGRGIVSEAIAFGAVQVPPHGQPIVLLKERQSIGGYPKIGAVLGLDCFALAQRRPGESVQFEPIAIEEAHALMREFYHFARRV